MAREVDEAQQPAPAKAKADIEKADREPVVEPAAVADKPVAEQPSAVADKSVTALSSARQTK
jgi:hypothetical protein